MRDYSRSKEPGAGNLQQNQKTRILNWDCIGGDQVEKIIFNGRVFVPEVSDNPAVVEKNDN